MKCQMSSEKTADLCFFNGNAREREHHGFLGVAVGFAGGVVPGVVVGVAFD